MSEKQKYNLMSLEPSEIIKHYQIETNKDGHYEPKFCYDLSSNELHQNLILSSTDVYFENALLAQIRFHLELSPDKKSNVKSTNEDYLKTRLIYMDFSKIFRQGNLMTRQELEDEMKRLDKYKEEDLRPGKAPVDILLYFLFKNGVELTIPDKSDRIKRTFIPYDKSGSMSRSNRITFIDEKIHSDIDKRLLLDMQFKDNNAILSKYYAYRGLYLSDGERIEESTDDSSSPGKKASLDTDNTLIFNEKTVIVIPDDHPYLKDINQISAASESEEPKDNNWKFQSFTDKLQLNPFDGEGLITPEYSALINKQLSNHNNPNSPYSATSFQIRMPFIKGVLHEVDFNKFFNEEIFNDLAGVDFENWKIEDFFGNERTLSEAKIILTESMLKNSKWLKDDNFYTDEQKPEDVMEIYFKKFHDYNHALYITNTNISLMGSQKYVKLNYQFLNTLNIGNDELNALVKNHMQYFEDLRQNPFELRKILNGPAIDEKNLAILKKIPLLTSMEIIIPLTKKTLTHGNLHYRKI